MGNDDTLTKDFKDAVNYINNSKDLNISNDEKLNLYKYFKQATIGNINISKPNILTLNQEPLLKYNSWLSVKNVSKENAMMEYINITNKYRQKNNTNSTNNNNTDSNSNVKINNDLLSQLKIINDNLQKK